MKTWDIDFSGSRVEATGPHGEFVKTADHFETVAEYETKLKALHDELNAECRRYHRAMTELTAFVENLTKGLKPQAPRSLDLIGTKGCSCFRLPMDRGACSVHGTPMRHVLPMRRNHFTLFGTDEHQLLIRAFAHNEPVELFGTAWHVMSYGRDDSGTRVTFELVEVV